MHKFSPQNAQRLENPERYKLLKPEHNLRKLGLGTGETFVDIGAGTGFFSRAASAIVGEHGTVFALDMSKEMLEILNSNGVTPNMRVLPSEEYLLPLNDSVSDFTLLSTVVHENTDVKRLLAEAARVTKSSGKIVIIEWKKQVEETGPPESERLALETLLPQLAAFNMMEQGDLTASHYYLVLRKKSD